MAPIWLLPMLAVRLGEWKLLMNPDRSRIELYNIPAAPIEMDKGVGEVIVAVRDAGIVDRTLVFFFSDDGLAGGSARPDRSKPTMCLLRCAC